jgi:hypothetical protein
MRCRAPSEHVHRWGGLGQIQPRTFVGFGRWHLEKTLICQCQVSSAVAKAKVKKLGRPDETRRFEKGKLQLVKFSGGTVGRAVFEPGWKWSKHVKPVAKTKSCEAPHFQYHVSGILHVKMDDGTEFDVGPGEVSMLPSGHDAWVVGVEPVTVIDFQGMVDYAKGSKK